MAEFTPLTKKMNEIVSEAITKFSQDYSFLSNFWVVPGGICLPSSEVLPGQEALLFPTVEHAYVAAKSLNPEERCAVASIPTPGKAKRFGVQIDVRPDWDTVKIPMMKSLLTQKFAVGTLLAEQLISTGEAELVEGNNWCDVFWGRCECPEHCPTGIVAEAPGANLLGVILMAQRTLLKLERVTK